MALPDNPDYSDLTAEFDTYGALKQSLGTEPFIEEVPLGVFVMTEVNVQDSINGATMEIQGVDRSIRIAKSLWVDPYPISASTNLATAISLLLSDRWAEVETDLQDTTQTVPAIVLGLQSGGSGQDPWQDASKLAQAGGFDLYFDGDGIAVLVPTPDPSDQSPVEVYEEGSEAMVLDVRRRINTDQTFNGVVVSGEGTNVTTLVRVVQFDEDPASPTYRYGAFGERPTFISSPLVTTEADAVAVATAQLSKLKGAEENVEWNQICDPSLDAGDVVQISNTGTRLDKIVVLDKVTIPLSPAGAMKATARTVRVLQESA
jgi:hypothetical protein